MVSREFIEERIKQNKSHLADHFFVSKIGLFGSYARGEQTTESDIDILIECVKPIGWDFIDLKDYLENILERKVDLVTLNALKPQLRDDILKEVIYQ